ncbi:MAG: IclR family transcriptional regulator [Verrucomicrobiota bacterium]
MSESSRYSAPALEKGLDILEYLSEQTEARSQTEIGRALDRSQGEIYRMLACLEGRGYVVKEGESGGYRLSLRLFELAHHQSTTAMLRRAARLAMDELSQQTGESCHLSVARGSSLTVLLELMPPRTVCLAVGEGTSMPMAQSASGLVLLSRLAAERAREVLEADGFFQELSRARQREVIRTIDEVRERGWLQIESQLSEGCVDIAIPVGVAGTETSAVLTVPFLTHRRGPKSRAEKIARDAKACAAEIDRRLGVSGAGSV